MTAKEASAILGCSVTYVRHLVSTRKLIASKQDSDSNQHGYTLDIPEAEVMRFKNKERADPRGWPRGKKRGTSAQTTGET